MRLLKNLFGKSKAKQPEEYYVTTITDEFVKVEHPRWGTEQILWTDIVLIKLINTDKGPVAPDIWFALLGKVSSCLIPHGSLGFGNVYEIISKYDNFNFENVIKSMSCAENKEFILWVKHKVNSSV